MSPSNEPDSKFKFQSIKIFLCKIRHLEDSNILNIANWRIWCHWLQLIEDWEQKHHPNEVHYFFHAKFSNATQQNICYISNYTEITLCDTTRKTPDYITYFAEQCFKAHSNFRN